MSADSAYNISEAVSGELLDSLLGGTALNYVGNRAFIRKSSLTARHEKMHVELGEMARQKKLAGDQESNRLHRATGNGAWISALHHHLNGTELSQEEFWDHLRLRYGMIPQDIPVTCDGCGKKFLIEHVLSCPRGGLFWSGMMTLQKSGVPLYPSPSSLVLSVSGNE